jgi:SNF2 family DNA or RNA helicase
VFYKKFRKLINDVLLLSGTPIKTNYAELAPYLYLIDPKFDEEALSIWLKIFRIDKSIASQIIRYRLQLIAIRQLKSHVLDLPEKHEEEVKVTIQMWRSITCHL